MTIITINNNNKKKFKNTNLTTSLARRNDNVYIYTHIFFTHADPRSLPVANNLWIQITPTPVAINLFHSYVPRVQTNITLIYLFCIADDLCVKNVLNTQLIY